MSRADRGGAGQICVCRVWKAAPSEAPFCLRAHVDGGGAFLLGSTRDGAILLASTRSGGSSPKPDRRGLALGQAEYQCIQKGGFYFRLSPFACVCVCVCEALTIEVISYFRFI